MKVQIMLDHNEIQEILINSISDQGIDLDGKKIDVVLTAGRAGKGNHATIDVSDAEETQEATVAKVPKTRKPKTVKKEVVSERTDLPEEIVEGDSKNQEELVLPPADDDESPFASNTSDKEPADTDSLFG